MSSPTNLSPKTSSTYQAYIALTQDTAVAKTGKFFTKAELQDFNCKWTMIGTKKAEAMLNLKNKIFKNLELIANPKEPLSLIEKNCLAIQMKPLDSNEEFTPEMAMEKIQDQAVEAMGNLNKALSETDSWYINRMKEPIPSQPEVDEFGYTI